MDQAKAMIETDPNRSFVVAVFDAGSNSKVRTGVFVHCSFFSAVSICCYVLFQLQIKTFLVNPLTSMY